MSRNNIIARINKWVPIQRGETFIYLNKYKATSPVIKKTQFSLVLSWACTVPKILSLGLISAVFSFDLEKQNSFYEGQMYVALSRVTIIDNLFLIGKYNSVFKINENAIREYIQ